MGKMTVEQILIQLMGGMLTSVQIFAVTLIFSLPLGLVVAFGRMSKNSVIRTIVKVYISIMRRSQTFFKIILPQVIKRILPSVTNEVITLVKDTSLAFTLSVMEMFSIAKMLAAAQSNMIPFVAAGLFYYVFNLVVALAMEGLEKKLNYYQ